MRPLAQWRCGPHGGDGNVRHGPAAESSQHKVGYAFPVVGIAAWRARSATSLHGRGWWRRALSAWCISARGSWQRSVFGRSCPRWCVIAGGDGLLRVGPP
jgi:hypothetical protein